MESKSAPKGRHFYIPGHLISLIETYAEANGGLPLSKAIAEIISDHLRTPTTGDNQPATKRDVKNILKKIELTNMILEPALLDLLESSAHAKFESKSHPEQDSLGRSIKTKYANLFRDLREIL